MILKPLHDALTSVLHLERRFEPFFRPALNALVPTMPDAASGAAPAREIARLDTMPRMAVLTRD